MKTIHKFLFLFSMCLITSVGCNTEELQNLNINPTAANQLDWKFVFTEGLVRTAENRYVNGRVHLNLAAGMAQHMATQSVGGERGSGDKYFYHIDSHNAYMDNVYEGSLKRLGEVIRQTGPEGLNPSWTNLHHIAQVAYILPMHIMTDLYGNVPYTEANNGVAGIFFPQFDEQEFIYNDMLAKLEAAASTIGTGPDDVGDADLIYNGDFSKWKKLANSLMLRLAMRISNVDPGTAQSFVQKAIAGGVMTSNEDLARVPMSSGPSQWFNQNGISRALIPDDWGADNMLSATLVNWLQERNDPRLGLIAVTGPWGGPWETDPALQMGMPNGMDTEDLAEFLGVAENPPREETWARLSPLLLDVDDPFIHMTHAEVEFLLAEAAVKGWHSGDAAEHYANGVRSSMQQWTMFDESLVVSDGEVDAYLAANPFDGTAQMAQEHNWAANFMQWYEAYSNWRRTKVPALRPVNYPGNETGGTVPTRVRYNTVEASLNPNAATQGTSPDNMTTKLWWDVN